MSIEKQLARAKQERGSEKFGRTTGSNFSPPPTTSMHTRNHSMTQVGSQRPEGVGFHAIINKRRQLERIDHDNARIYVQLKNK